MLVNPSLLILKKATVKEALKWRDGDAQIEKVSKFKSDGSLNNDGATLDYIEPEVLT